MFTCWPIVLMMLHNWLYGIVTSGGVIGVRWIYFPLGKFALRGIWECVVYGRVFCCVREFVSWLEVRPEGEC